jgi:ribosomal protein S18 acetylase RimI-like enzyme
MMYEAKLYGILKGFYLHVDEANEAARALYASMGFTQNGDRIVDYYGSGRHALELELELGTG